LYFEGSPPAEDPHGVMWWGENLLYFYIPMFPWKDFLMEQIRKIQKHKEEMEQIRKKKFKNKKERMEERKRRDFIFMKVIYMKVPILMCSPSVRNTLGLLPS
jgi:hypothetical protein